MEHKSKTRVQVDDRMAFELYGEGKLDTEIAEAIGCTKATILNWRKRNGLPCQANRSMAKATPERSKLAQDAMNARTHGMSYGMWVAHCYRPPDSRLGRW